MPSTPRPHEFTCRLRWTGAASGPTLGYREYSRTLAVEISGKPTLPMSAAPAFLGDSAAHNPEDLLVAALSSCHCLSYLALAARRGIAVVDYTDEAYGIMEYAETTYRFTRVTLKPVVTVRKGSDLAKARALHEDAHHSCFIANSVNFAVTNEPVIIEAME
jgi:organic hydroperoxide reductase OsmC/OhrA